MAFTGAIISVAKLKNLIVEKDTNVAALARKLGMSAGGIFAWYKRGKETGNCGIDSELFEELQKALGVPASALKPDPTPTTQQQSGPLKIVEFAAKHGLLPGDIVTAGKMVQRAEAANRSKKSLAAAKRTGKEK